MLINKKTGDYLFYLLLVLIPFNIRHIFNFEAIKHLEGFREHLTWSLYPFDIIFGILLGLFLYDLIAQKSFSPKKILASPLFYFVLIILISTLLSQIKIVSFYNGARIIEGILFFFIAKNLLKDKKVFKNSAWIIFLSGLFQSILAFCQIIFQKSLGLKILGESVIASDILGVAKIEIGGEKFIRAYGTFSHPNLLGVFLFFSLVCSLWLFNFYKQNKLPFLTFNSHTNKNIYKKKYISWGVLLTLLAIFFSFSRSTWLITVGFLSIYFYSSKKEKIKNIWQIMSQKEKKLLIICFSTILASLVLSGILYFKKIQTSESYQLRKNYNSFAIEIIKSKPFIGIGGGNFSNVLTVLKNDKNQNIPPWQIQPAHNLYLLIASETGLAGLGFFIIFIFYGITKKLSSIKKQPEIFSNNLKIANLLFFYNLLFFIFLGLSDHYFWTLPQGQWLWWLATSFFYSSNS